MNRTSEAKLLLKAMGFIMVLVTLACLTIPIGTVFVNPIVKSGLYVWIKLLVTMLIMFGWCGFMGIVGMKAFNWVLEE